jgi:hypothetical protein
MPDYLVRLHKLAEHLNRIHPKFVARLSTQAHAHYRADLEKLHKQKQVLHILLSQADAFNEKNFFDTQKYVARLLSDTHAVFARLLKGIPGGFDGNVPSSDGQEPPQAQALLQLFTRIYVINNREEVRTRRTSLEFWNFVHEHKILRKQMIIELNESIMKQIMQNVLQFMAQLAQRYASLVQQQQNEVAVEQVRRQQQVQYNYA